MTVYWFVSTDGEIRRIEGVISEEQLGELEAGGAVFASLEPIAA